MFPLVWRPPVSFVAISAHHVKRTTSVTLLNGRHTGQVRLAGWEFLPKLYLQNSEGKNAPALVSLERRSLIHETNAFDPWPKTADASTAVEGAAFTMKPGWSPPGRAPELPSMSLLPSGALFVGKLGPPVVPFLTPFLVGRVP